MRCGKNTERGDREYWKAREHWKAHPEATSKPGRNLDEDPVVFACRQFDTYAGCTSRPFCQPDHISEVEYGGLW
jgi:hypothetical protein